MIEKPELIAFGDDNAPACEDGACALPEADGGLKEGRN